MDIIELNPQTEFSEIAGYIALLYSELFGESAVLSETILKKIESQWLGGSGFHKAYKIVEKGEVLAFFTLAESFSFFAHGRYGIINELWVSPEHRSKGFGGKVLDVIKGMSKQNGWERIDVSAPPFDEWKRSFEFYQKNGFELTGKKLKYIND